MSDWALIEHVTEYMRRPRLGNRRDPQLRPSEASAIIKNEWDETEVVGKCRRAMYFRYLNDLYEVHPEQYTVYEPLIRDLKEHHLDTDPYMLWIWRAGDMYEEHVVGLAKNSGVFIEAQVPVVIPEYKLSGKTDVVVINPDTGKYSIAEVKSVYGFGGDEVLGKRAARSAGNLGHPRDSNLMQLAIYEWWLASDNPDFESARLVYGSRDTGRFAEYMVRTTPKGEQPIGSGLNHIYYTGIAPNHVPEVMSPITVDSIFAQYQFVLESIDNGHIPARDYDLQYSDEKITTLYNRKQLNKSETERYEKRAIQIQEGKTKINKQIEKGDWQCSLCSYRNVCYGEDGQPRSV